MRYRKRSSQVLSGLDNWREDKDIASGCCRSLGYDVGIGDKVISDVVLVRLVAFGGAGPLSGFDRNRVIQDRLTRRVSDER